MNRSLIGLVVGSVAIAMMSFACASSEPGDEGVAVAADTSKSAPKRCTADGCYSGDTSSSSSSSSGTLDADPPVYTFTCIGWTDSSQTWMYSMTSDGQCAKQCVKNCIDGFTTSLYQCPWYAPYLRCNTLTASCGCYTY